MATKNEIKKHALSLYLQRDKEGKRKYSLRDIADEIERNFNKKFTHVTIGNWSKEGDWDAKLRKAVQFGIQQSMGDGFDIEEKIVEAAANDLAEVYKNGKILTEIGLDVLQRAYHPTKEKPKHKTITNVEALGAIRTGANIMARLNSIINPIDDEENDYGIIYMPDNGR